MITKLNTHTGPRDANMFRPNSHCMGCTCTPKQVQQAFEYRLSRLWIENRRIEAMND